MSSLLRGSVVSGVVALSITTFGFVGVANAATPTAVSAARPTGAVTNAADIHRVPDRGFRARFRSRQECEQRADRDYPGRRGNWDCRQGKDHNNPWELWAD